MFNCMEIVVLLIIAAVVVENVVLLMIAPAEAENAVLPMIALVVAENVVLPTIVQAEVVDAAHLILAPVVDFSLYAR